MSNDLTDDFANYRTPTSFSEPHKHGDRFPDPQPAFRCGIVGVGQCGNNMATAFHRVGYGRVLAINSAKCDLDSVPEEIEKFELNRYGTGQSVGKGAGKDREVGRRLVTEHAPQIRSAMAETFGEDFDKIIVCMSLGGGTGSGGGPEIVRIAQHLAKEHGLNPDRDVIVFAVFPDPITGGGRQCFNALKAYTQLERLGVPRLYIDNTRLQKIITATFADGWTPINNWVVHTFHRFNAFATRSSELGVCDGNDLEGTLLDRFIFSAFLVDDLQNHKHAIGGIMAEHLANSLFAKTNLSTAKTAACLLVLNQSAVQNLGMNEITPALTGLNALMNGGTLHTGIYPMELQPSANGPAPDLFCYVMLGGLDHPNETLNALFEQARRYDPGYGSLSAFLDEK